MKRSVILTDRLGPDILPAFCMNGQDLHRERAHLKVPGFSIVLNVLLTRKLPTFLSRLNAGYASCNFFAFTADFIQTRQKRRQLSSQCFKSAPLIPTHQRTLFIQLIYSCFSRNLVSTNSIAPCSVYKPYTTHNSYIRSGEGLTLETSAFQSLYGGQFTLSTPLINLSFVYQQIC